MTILINNDPKVSKIYASSPSCYGNMNNLSVGTSSNMNVTPNIEKGSYKPNIISSDFHKLANLGYLRSIQEFEKNWNYYSAEPFKSTFIQKIRELITNLVIQPIIMPTGRESIILSFRFTKGNELVIEIYEEKISILKIYGSQYGIEDDVISESVPNFDSQFITRLVEVFYDETSSRER